MAAGNAGKVRKIPALAGFERTEKEKKEALAKNKPLLLSLYLDTACNLNCCFCFLDSGKSRNQEQLSLAQYKDLIRQGKKLGIKSVLFFGAGEPLLDNKLFPLIGHSNKLGLYSVMFTNASTVTKKIAKKLKKMRVSVVASVKSRNPKTLEKLTGVKGSAKKIFSGFQRLLDAGLNQSTPTRLGIDILLCRQSYDEIPELLNYCINNNIHPMIETLACKGRAARNYGKLELTAKEKQSFSETVAKDFPEIKRERAYLNGTNCDLDQYTIFVNYNGDIWQCFSRDIIAGNVKKENLSEIWNKPELKKLRETPINSSCGLCRGRKYCLEKFTSQSH